MASAEGFDEFYVATRGRLLQQLALMTLDRELAQDNLQEAYVKAWQRWSRVSGLEDPESWVRTVAYRGCISQWRRLATAARHRPRIATSSVAPDVDLDSALDLRDALGRLPRDQRVALVLFELCDLPVDEIAAQLGVPSGTVKSRLSRGRAALGMDLRGRAALDLSPMEVHDV